MSISSNLKVPIFNRLAHLMIMSMSMIIGILKYQKRLVSTHQKRKVAHKIIFLIFLPSLILSNY